MRTKKIKAFSVEEKTYEELIKMFKESNTEVSLSYYVDKCLKDLHGYLVSMEKDKKKRKCTVPLSFIIEEVVKSPVISIGDEFSAPGMFTDTFSEIGEWQMEYEARKMKLPRLFYRLIKSGKYKLTPDRKHIINLETKLRYTIDKFGDLMSAPYDEALDSIGKEGV